MSTNNGRAQGYPDTENGVGRLGEVQAAVEAGLVAAGSDTLTDGLHAFVIPANAKVELVDIAKTLAEHAEHPERQKGTFKAHDADSFVRYLLAHATTDETEVWADAIGKRIVGVLNAHQNSTSPVGDAGPVAAGWSDHRVTYDVAYTDAWKAWTEFDRKLMGQSEFAELIEMRLVDIVTPTAADMLELAQSFEANIGVRFESSRVLSSGERQLTYKEDVSSSAGRSGQLEIPKEFHLGLIPFEGCPRPYDVTARFRFRITDGTLRLGYVLVRPEDILRDAFADVVDAITEGVGAHPVFKGVTA